MDGARLAPSRGRGLTDRVERQLHGWIVGGEQYQSVSVFCAKASNELISPRWREDVHAGEVELDRLGIRYGREVRRSSQQGIAACGSGDKHGSEFAQRDPHTGTDILYAN